MQHIILKFFRPRTAQISRTPAKRNGNSHRPEREFYQSQGSNDPLRCPCSHEGPVMTLKVSGTIG